MGQWKGQQSHHAIDFDFLETLNQTPGLKLFHPLITDQNAAKSIAMQAKVRPDLCRATENTAAGQAVMIKQA